jgi:hypothetical protein
MNRFLLFSGDHFYPAGGWHDFQNSFDSLEEAKLADHTDKYEWSMIVDSTTGTIVDPPQTTPAD